MHPMKTGYDCRAGRSEQPENHCARGLELRTLDLTDALSKDTDDGSSRSCLLSGGTALSYSGPVLQETKSTVRSMCSRCYLHRSSGKTVVVVLLHCTTYQQNSRAIALYSTYSSRHYYYSTTIVCFTACTDSSSSRNVPVSHGTAQPLVRAVQYVTGNSCSMFSCRTNC